MNLGREALMARSTGFLDLERVIVPASLAVAANEHLRSAGRRGCEGFALWAGRRDGGTFVVTQTVIPRQTAIHSAGGVCVTVNGKELFRLNVQLYESGLTLVAQLHSHPDEAYHSKTDDAFPIATTVGALSLVVPDFAAHPFSLERCATYRLLPDQGWTELPPPAVRDLIHLDHTN